eukprot:3767342-Pleurochrysis_carterae.AAC.1
MGSTDTGHHGKGDQELHSKRRLQCGNGGMDQQIRETTEGRRCDISGLLGGLKLGSKHNGRPHVRKGSDTDR